MTKTPWRYRYARAFASLFAVFLLCLVPALAPAADWPTTEVDNAADVGRFASLALDTNKKLHVGYLDAAGKLKYATDAGGGWDVDTLLGSSVALAGTSIAVDSATNRPQISYYYDYSSYNRGIRNIAYNGSSWSVSDPTNNGDYSPGPDSSIFNSNGYTHMVFVRTSDLYYTKNTAAYNYGAWSNPVRIDSANNSGYTNSIVVNGQTGKAYVVGYNSGSTDLFFYTNESGSWVKSTLATSTTSVGKGCYLAIDPNGNLYLTYLETTATTYKIRYRYRPAGGNWQAAVDVADAGAYGGAPSIAVEDNGVAHISFYYSAASDSGALRYATNLDGPWSVENVDTSSGNIGMYSSIVVDSNRLLSIAYFDVSRTSLKVARKQVATFPAISVAPSALQFGSVGRTGSRTLPVIITNGGEAPLAISSISIGGASAAQFSAGSCSSVPAGGNCSVDVTLAPDGGGVKSASLSISSNDPARPTVQVSLGGSSPWLITAGVGNGGTGGSITPSGVVGVAPGQSVTFAVSAAGAPFSLSDVQVDGVTAGAIGSYTFANVAADHSIESFFVSPLRLVGIPFLYYASLQQAFNAMVDAGTVQAESSIATGELVMNRPVEATVRGGYDAGFGSQSGSTKLSSITVSNGNLIPEGLVLQ